MGLTSIDWITMAVHSVFVLWVGVALKRYMKTSTHLFLADRSSPAWVCGLAISVNDKERIDLPDLEIDGDQPAQQPW